MAANRESAPGRTIKIQTKTGETSMHAVYVTGHFAVHRTSVTDPKTYDGTWTVTHVPTGRSVTSFCASEDQAREIADWVKAEFDKRGVDAAESNVLSIRTSMSHRELWNAINPRLDGIQRDHLLASIGAECDS